VGLRRPLVTRVFREDEMKIAITCKGEDLDSQVDPRFGRAKAFVIYDLETGEYEVVKNEQDLESPHGAGIQAARIVSGRGVEYVLTGHCGPNAFRTLNAADINIIVGVGGTVREAIEKFKNNEYRVAKQEDVEGHWV